MSSFLTRRLINRGLIFQCRGMVLSSSLKADNKPDATRNTANVQSSKKTALYDFHLNNFGRM
jgi:hypothetical protein